MSWYVNAGGEPMGPLSESKVIAMLRAGVRVNAVARQIDKHWWEPRAYPPFAEALLQGEAHSLAGAADSGTDPVALRVRPRRRVLWLVACVSLFAGVAWWASPAVRRAVAATGALTETVAPTEVAPAPVPQTASLSEHLAAPVPTCDIEALWFRGHDLTPTQRRSNVVDAVGQWTTDCRWQAMDHICRGGCDGLLSDTLLNASPKGERSTLAKLRSERNRDVAQRGRVLYNEVSDIARWAMPTARSGEQAASKAAPNLDACQEHLAKDAARIDRIHQVLDGAGPAPAGAYWLKEALVTLQSCCESDRSHCVEVTRLMKSAGDDIRDRDHRAEVDKRATTAALAH